MSNLPDPAPARLHTLSTGLLILAPDACFTCEGTRLVKRGAPLRLGARAPLYPHTTATGLLDRPVMPVFACPTCDGTGLRVIDDVDREMYRRMGEQLP